MKVACVFLVLAVTGALSMNIRPKRQSSQPNSTNVLEDRYNPLPNNPNGNFPGQFNQYPGFVPQGQFNQYPGFVPQGQFNQYPGVGPQFNQYPGVGPQFNQYPGFVPPQGQFTQYPGLIPQGQYPGWFPPPNNGRVPTGPGGNSNQLPVQPTTAAPDDATFQACLRDCPVTSEYNPVCGSDGTTYSNPGRLGCAQNCGLTVSLSRSAPCPPTTTAAPAAN